jgi:tetratricopeptide (TPR) repeat protein
LLLAYHYVQAENWQKAQEYLFKAGDQAGRIAADAEALAHYQQATTVYARAFGDRWDPLQRAILERKMGEALFRRGDHHKANEYLQRALTLLGAPCPSSRWGIRLSIVRQVVQQLGHRLFPRLLLRPPVDRPDAVMVERSRIYELMAWMDYFMDQERLVFDCLMELNVSERYGLPMGVAIGSMGVGIICDVIPFFGFASYYHHRALELAEQSQHQVVAGIAHHGLAFHGYYEGKWDDALEHHRRGTAAYREAGDLRRWGALTDFMGGLYCFRGQFELVLDQAREMIRVGQEGADALVSGWGLHLLGILRCRIGPLDEAVVHLRQTIELLRSVPAYPNMADAMGYLGQCYLRQEKLTEAHVVLGEATQLITEHGLRGHEATSTRNGVAEAYLLTAERAEGATRADALKKSRHACRAALKEGKIFRGALPHATRLQGRYEWLTGEQAAAQQWWSRSLAIAEELGARYELGMTYMEIGQRMGLRKDLQRAQATFTEIGDGIDLAEACKLLSRCSTS